jgi:hypothetical protein
VTLFTDLSYRKDSFLFFNVRKKIVLRRTVSLLTVLIFASALTLSGIKSLGQGSAKGSLDERLGADDGAALAILFGANMRGNLDTCD